MKGDRALSSRFLQYSGQLHISVLTASELYTWANRRAAPGARLVAVRTLLLATELVDVNHEIAERAGMLRAQLLDVGKPMPTVDLVIAATALLHDFTLVTHNTRHFENVTDLRMHDWLST